MSEHTHKVHPIPAAVMVLVIAGLVTWGMLVMNPEHAVGAYIAGILLTLFGWFAVLVIGHE